MLITFNMIVQNEADIIGNTLEDIKDMMVNYIPEGESELVIVDGGSTDDTVNICRQYTENIYVRNFDKDFAAQKNYANSKSKGIYVFNIDADELIGEGLKLNLYNMLNNRQVDLVYVPRINIVQNITMAHIKQWQWHVDDAGHINWPDYQSRIYKNDGKLMWRGQVHETIQPTMHQEFIYTHLPAEKDYKMYIIHLKDIQRQEKQNKQYMEYANE